MLKEVCAAPGELDDEEGAVGVGFTEFFCQSQFGAEAPLDFTLEGGALDEFPGGVPPREVVDVDVVVAVLVFGILLGGEGIGIVTRALGILQPSG